MISFERIKELFRWTIFTNRCRYCGRLLTLGEPLCDECRENLPIIKGKGAAFAALRRNAAAVKSTVCNMTA